jgi:hypothetical protein
MTTPRNEQQIEVRTRDLGRCALLPILRDVAP